MSLQKSDYQRLYQITKKRLNELPMQSNQFEDVRNLLSKLRDEVEKFSLHNVRKRALLNWFDALKYVGCFAAGFILAAIAFSMFF